MEDIRRDEYTDLVLGQARTYQEILNAFAEERRIELQIAPDVQYFQPPEGGDNIEEYVNSIMTSGANNYIRALSRIESSAGVAKDDDKFSPIALTTDLRTQILSKIETIRKIIYQSDLDKPVESKILRSLSRFQRSVEEMRTTIAQYGQIAVDLAETAGEAAERLDPALRVLERIGRIFKTSQVERIEGNETPRQLPKPDDD